MKIKTESRRFIENRSPFAIWTIRIGYLLLILTFGLSIVYVNRMLLPWLASQFQSQASVTASRDDVVLLDCIETFIHGMYESHAEFLLNSEEWIRHSSKLNLDLIDIFYTQLENDFFIATGFDPGDMSELPDVIDVFELRPLTDRHSSIYHTIPSRVLVDSLFRYDKRLDPKSEPRWSTGESESYDLIGKMTRFKRIDFEGQSYLLLVRYVETGNPKTSREIIGLVLEEGRIKDDLAKYLSHFTAEEINSFYLKSGQILPSRQAFYVTLQSDTLWWYKDPDSSGEEAVLPADTDESDDPVIRQFSTMRFDLREVGIQVHIRLENDLRTGIDAPGSRAIRKIIILMEVFIFLLAVALGFSIYLVRQQFIRNAIALAHLAHSIKSPVARLKLNTETLLEGRVASPDEEIEGLEAINDDCQRLEQAMLNSTLSMIKGRQLIRFKTVNLSDLVIEIALSWRLAFEKAGLDIVIDHSGAQLRGRFDPVLIRIAIDNLIDNALHYARLNKSNIPVNFEGVTVRIQRKPGIGVIIIDDTGIGVPDSQFRRIFKKFYRGRDLALTSASGLGLGLSLVRKIVKAHNGEVYAATNPLQGARFVIELPIIR